MTGGTQLAHGPGHDGLGWTFAGLLTVLAVSSTATGYLWAWWAARDRGRWPTYRVVLWLGGVTCLAVALVGPVASASHDSFTAHMAGHLLIGMLGPLLLVRAAPVTLLLRALPASRARAVTAVLASRGVRLLGHPVTAGLLNAGGLWLLYTTSLHDRMHTSPVVHVVVHLHLLLAGYLFTDALVGVDPRRHRPAFAVRAAVLVVFVAAHSVLAKWLYAYPLPGVAPEDARTGAQLMYYGGDVVDLTLVVLLFVGAFRASGRRVSRTDSGDARRVVA